jgi:hypothetical protein
MPKKTAHKVGNTVFRQATTETQIREMTQRQRGTREAAEEERVGQYVTDNEHSEDEEWETERIHRGWRNRLREGFRRMRRLDPFCDGQPRVGEQCIIMVGKAGHDLGQVGRVTDVKAVMVEVAYRGPQENGQIVYKNKRPSSLIMLEDGLEVVQSADGIVRIQRQRQEERGTVGPQ